MSDSVVGVVVGSRKCGTTWLYENFKKDPDVTVSLKVKESGFFAAPDDTDTDAYDSLYPGDDGSRVEVDSSLIYSDVSAGKILRYKPEMRVALILREPVEYAVSRFVHSVRKGEIAPRNIAEAVVEEELLREELNYPKLLQRFEIIEARGNMLVVPFSLLQCDPTRFYCTVKNHLIRSSGLSFEPPSDKINVARQSRWAFGTSALSRAAIMARGLKLHSIVNLAKSTGLHKLLEKPYENVDVEQLKDAVRPSIVEHYADSVSLYDDIERKYACD